MHLPNWLLKKIKMSLFKFIGFFIVGLIANVFIVSTIRNPFLIGIIDGLIIGILGAKD